MNSQLRLRVGRGLLVLLLCTGGISFGEVSTFINPETGTISGIILGRIIEDADPVENSIWEMIRPNHYATLNPDGAIGDRNDGTPSIVRLDDGTAIAFWDYGLHSGDRDIVMSRWSAEGWGTVQWVSDAPELEYDPRAVEDGDGTIHLAWWSRPVAGTSRHIRYNALDADGGWAGAETIVSNSDPFEPQNASRSFSHVDLAINGGNLYFAYEVTDNFHGERWIEIAKRLEPNKYVYSELFALPAAISASDLGLHHVGDLMWLEWRTDDDHFAYSVFDGASWSEPTELALNGNSWVDIEQVRIEIRRTVVNSQLQQVRGPGG